MKEAETQGKAFAKWTCRGAKRKDKKCQWKGGARFATLKRGHIGRVEKQLGLNM